MKNANGTIKNFVGKPNWPPDLLLKPQFVSNLANSYTWKMRKWPGFFAFIESLEALQGYKGGCFAASRRMGDFVES